MLTSLIDTNKEKYHIFASMSSWLSGEERGLQSESAQVRITVEAEREEELRREENEGRRDCIVKVEREKMFLS